MFPQKRRPIQFSNPDEKQQMNVYRITTQFKPAWIRHCNYNSDLCRYLRKSVEKLWQRRTLLKYYETPESYSWSSSSKPDGALFLSIPRYWVHLNTGWHASFTSSVALYRGFSQSARPYSAIKGSAAAMRPPMRICLFLSGHSHSELPRMTANRSWINVVLPCIVPFGEFLLNHAL